MNLYCINVTLLVNFKCIKLLIVYIYKKIQYVDNIDNNKFNYLNYYRD